MTNPSPTVEQIGDRWIARVSYEQRQLAKDAGFRWDPASRVWYTKDADVAAGLSDPEARARAAAAREEKARAEAEQITRSRAASSSITIPCPEGLAYLPYQIAGVEFALNQLGDRGTLLADEMGLGKTIQLIGIINADETVKRVLVICPASLRLNWMRELNKWLVRKMSVGIANGSFWPHGFDVVIINYDILSKHVAKLRETEWDLIALDESHYLKNPDAKRTQLVVGRAAKKNGEKAIPGLKARRRVALTGTPIPNRPIEGWSIFHYLAPDVFPKFWYYVEDFCNAQHNGYGWDFNGASNLGKLQDKLRASIMVRRKKLDVLKELPPKQRQLVELSRNGAAAAIDAENEAYEKSQELIERKKAAVELAKAESQEQYNAAVAELRAVVGVAFEEISELRHRTAVAKIPQVAEHILSCLEEEGHKIIAFAHHRDVIASLLNSLREAGITCVSVTGDTLMVDRQTAVDRFQQDDDVRVFVGNIQAAGVGLTLTASHHVIFAELDWVPGNVTQAEDRAHRIGQHDNVLVQHLVLDGSLDVKMARTLIAKQTVIDAALDDEKKALAEEPEAPTGDSATKSLTRSTLEVQALSISPEKIAAAHEAMRILAGMDHDFARNKNDIGFSRIDVFVGHSLAGRPFLSPKQGVLAAKLANKYRRQLPESLLAVLEVKK
jgi:SWI/SNF-related matrix-associated actin-dependent regulator 1 of chromatin subfamily A